MALLDTEFGVKGSSIIREWSGQVQPALVASFVFLFCLEACLWVRNLRLKRRLPGPFAWPVVGNAMQLGQMPHITFSKLAKKYGNVYQIRLGCNNIVVLNGDTAIREALVQHSTEFAGRPNFVSFQSVSGGNSMTFSNYSKQWSAWNSVKETIIEKFAGPYDRGEYSPSVQKTLYDTQVIVLDRVPEIEEIEIVMPNQHYFTIDMTKMGLTNNNEVLLPLDNPSGNIMGTVRRKLQAKL